MQEAIPTSTCAIPLCVVAFLFACLCGLFSGLEWPRVQARAHIHIRPLVGNRWEPSWEPESGTRMKTRCLPQYQRSLNPKTKLSGLKSKAFYGCQFLVSVCSMVCALIQIYPGICVLVESVAPQSCIQGYRNSVLAHRSRLLVYCTICGCHWLESASHSDPLSASHSIHSLHGVPVRPARGVIPEVKLNEIGTHPSNTERTASSRRQSYTVCVQYIKVYVQTCFFKM